MRERDVPNRGRSPRRRDQNPAAATPATGGTEHREAHALFGLQRSAGNQAVASGVAVIQRLSADAGYFDQAVGARLWSNAALRLNGLAQSEVAAVLRKLSLEQLRFLREGLVAAIAGWPRQAALLADVDSAMTKASSGKSARSILLDAINALLTERRFGEAVIKMHGLNEPDVRRFIKRRSAAVVYDLAVAANALGWQTYVLTSLQAAVGAHSGSAKVHGDFDRSLQQGNYEDVALALNAMSAPDLIAHLRRIPPANLSLVLSAAATAMPGWPPVVGDAIINLHVGQTLTIVEREQLRAMAAKASRTEALIYFDHRFRIPTDGDWSKAALLAVWDQLDLLPDAQVTPAIVTKLVSTMGDGGAANGQIIELGQALAGLGHSVRHEVAHALQSAGTISPNGLLANYWTAPSGLSAGSGNPATELAALITAHGGYKRGTTAAQQAAGLAALVTYFGAFDGLSSGPSGQLPRAATAVLRPKTISTLSLAGLNFWFNYSNYPRAGDGKQWFYNPYYKRSLAFNAQGAHLINLTGDAYTSMSDLEFFANVYATYFASPDPKQWGSGLPGAVKAWFKTNVIPVTSTAFAGGATPPRQKRTPK